MPRYSFIPVITTEENQLRRYVVTRYPQIPVSPSDTYVYTVRGDRYDTLAQNYYSDYTLWWIISHANPNQPSDSLYPEIGAQIRIPGTDLIGAILSRYENINLNV